MVKRTTRVVKKRGKPSDSPSNDISHRRNKSNGKKAELDYAPSPPSENEEQITVNPQKAHTNQSTKRKIIKITTIVESCKEQCHSVRSNILALSEC